MPNVQIRNVPADVHRRLKERAAAAGQSLNEYLLGEMRAIAKRPSIAELTERIQAHTRAPYDGPSPGEVAALIREDRDSR